MAWDGSGTFTRTNGQFSGSEVWESDRKAGIKILAARHDTHDEDIATGINNLWNKDGSNTPTANINMNGFKHTGVDNGDSGQLLSVRQRIEGRTISGTLASGSGTAYTTTMSPAVTAYTDGAQYNIPVDTANTTTTPTLNIDSVGAKTIHKMSGALATSDIGADSIIWVVYDGTADEFMLINPATK